MWNQLEWAQREHLLKYYEYSKLRELGSFRLSPKDFGSHMNENEWDLRRGGSWSREKYALVPNNTLACISVSLAGITLP